MEKIKKKITDIYQYLGLPLFVVYAMMILFIIIAVAGVFVTGGMAFNSLFFYDRHDTGMDFFNIVAMLKVGNPFDFTEYGAFYPPLAYLLIYVFSSVIPYSAGYNGYLRDVSFSLRGSQIGLMVFIFYTILAITILAYVLFKLFGEKKEKEKLFLVVAFLLLSPFLFLYERGNLLLFTLFFMMIFMLWHGNKSKVKNEIALISLAIAIVLKIYPVFFMIILFKQKKYKEICRMVVYGIFLFFVPFMFFGGIKTIGVFIDNLLYGVNATAQAANYSFRIDINAFFYILSLLGLKAGSTLVYLCMIILLAIQGFLAFTTTSSYKLYTCLSLMAVVLVPFNYYYAAVFYALPFCLFIKSRPTKKIDLAYGIMFLLLLLPFIFGQNLIDSLGVSMIPSVLMCNIAQIGMVILLITDFIIQFVRKKKLTLKERFVFE